MTIASGNSIQSFDFNVIQNLVSSLLGTSSTGYYQPVTSAQVQSGRVFSSSDLAALRADITKCRRHQTGADYSAVELPVLSLGSAIRASDLALYQSCANTVWANSYTAAPANMTLTGSALTITRGAAWGDNSTFSTIGAEALADFGSNAAMNAFFNTGGEIRWSLAHPSAATAQDTSWLNLLNSLGPFNIHGGSSKAQSATVVYYPLNSLTTTYQTIFTATSASTSYTSNTVTINAKLNAASTGVVIQVLLTDAHANAFYDSVAAGTRITFSHLKSTVVLTGITTPTFTTITNF